MWLRAGGRRECPDGVEPGPGLAEEAVDRPSGDGVRVAPRSSERSVLVAGIGKEGQGVHLAAAAQLDAVDVLVLLEREARLRTAGAAVALAGNQRAVRQLPHRCDRVDARAVANDHLREPADLGQIVRERLAAAATVDARLLVRRGLDHSLLVGRGLRVRVGHGVPPHERTTGAGAAPGSLHALGAQPSRRQATYA